MTRSYEAVFAKEDDGGYVVEIPELPGCISEGKSFEEAFNNIREALEAWLEEAKDHPDFIAHINRDRIRVDIEVQA